MDKYNQLMLKFWGIVSIILPVVITYFVITEGFQKWGQYYILAIFTVSIFSCENKLNDEIPMIKKINKFFILLVLNSLEQFRKYFYWCLQSQYL